MTWVLLLGVYACSASAGWSSRTTNGGR